MTMAATRARRLNDYVEWRRAVRVTFAVLPKAAWAGRAAAESAAIRILARCGGAKLRDACAQGTAHELVLAFYGRIPLDSLKLDGNRVLFDQLVDWDPER